MVRVCDLGRAGQTVADTVGMRAHLPNTASGAKDLLSLSACGLILRMHGKPCRDQKHRSYRQDKTLHLFHISLSDFCLQVHPEAPERLRDRNTDCAQADNIALWSKMLFFLQVHLEGGKLSIDQEGRSRKFTKQVQQKTFAASSANGREIMYVTERAVFKLREGQGLELVEVAPGMAVTADVIMQWCSCINSLCWCCSKCDVAPTYR